MPEYQVQAQVEMDAAIALRAQLKEAGSDVAPSLNDIIVKASALALRRHPRVNGSYKDGRFEFATEPSRHPNSREPRSPCRTSACTG